MQAGRPLVESPQSGTCVDMSPCDQTTVIKEKVLFRGQTCKCFFSIRPNKKNNCVSGKGNGSENFRWGRHTYILNNINFMHYERHYLYYIFSVLPEKI